MFLRKTRKRNRAARPQNTRLGQRVLLLGYFGRGNLGDDAMHQGLHDFLAQELPTATIRSQSLPSWTLKATREAGALIHGLRWADTVILAGGTHFHDGYGLRSIRILTTHWLLFSAARLSAASVGYAGVGVGPLDTPGGRWLTRRIINRASIILVRDHSSRTTLVKLAVSPPVVTGFDSACLLQRPVVTPARPPRIGISVIPYFGTFNHDEKRDRVAVQSIAVALAGAVQNHTLDTEILAFNTQGRITDLPVSRELHDILLGRIPVSLYTCSTPNSTLLRLANMSGLVATRYHAALLGYLVGLPMIMIAYESKCFALAQHIGLPEQAIISPEQLLAPRLLQQKIECLAGAPDSMRAKVSVSDSIESTLAGLRDFTQHLLASDNSSAR